MATSLGARDFTEATALRLKVRDSHGAGEHAQATFEDPASLLGRASVDSSTSTVTLAAQNSNRRGLRVYNNSSAALYVKEGSGCTNTDFDTIIPAATEWIMDKPIYIGIVTGVWASANGNAKVTERA